VYRFVAATLVGPGRSELDLLRGAGSVFDDLGLDAFAFAPAVRRTLGALQDVEFDALVSAHADFAGAQGLCPLSESAWRADPRRGEVAAVRSALLRGLRIRRLAPIDEHRHDADHIVVELEAMAVMCSREADAAVAADPVDALRRVLTDQRWLLDEHLGLWVGDLADEAGRRDRSGVFAAVTAAAHSLVDHDRQYVGLRLQVLAESGAGTIP
jgi:hypothetical protein